MTTPTEGLTTCYCGSKYWDGNICASCGETASAGTTRTDEIRFEVGKRYTTGAGRDYVWEFTILKRTAKFITILDFHGHNGATKRVGITVLDGIEMASPLGVYSMNPILRANREVA